VPGHTVIKPSIGTRTCVRDLMREARPTSLSLVQSWPPPCLPPHTLCSSRAAAAPLPHLRAASPQDANHRLWLPLKPLKSLDWSAVQGRPHAPQRCQTWSNLGAPVAGGSWSAFSAIRWVASIHPTRNIHDRIHSCACLAHSPYVFPSYPSCTRLPHQVDLQLLPFWRCTLPRLCALAPRGLCCFATALHDRETAVTLASCHDLHCYGIASLPGLPQHQPRPLSCVSLVPTAPPCPPSTAAGPGHHPRRRECGG